MAQILDPLPSEQTAYLICCYVNVTSQIQVVRITNIPNWYFERVVFPGQRLVFEALPEAHLEIHTGMLATAILTDTIDCLKLCIDEENHASALPITEVKLEKTHHKSKLEMLNENGKEMSKALKTPA